MSIIGYGDIERRRRRRRRARIEGLLLLAALLAAGFYFGLGVAVGVILCSLYRDRC